MNNKKPNGNKKENENKKSGSASAELRRFLLKTSVLAVGVFVLVTCVFRIHRAVGNTMSPFVRDGDLCIFLKAEKVSLGDVVLYRDVNESLKIGRITAVGGQILELQDTGGYTVDGYQPTEEIPYETWKAEGSDVEYPMELSEDEVFMMNDFRSITEDSRICGPVKQNNIEGKLLFLLRRRGF